VLTRADLTLSPWNAQRTVTHPLLSLGMLNP
jgi:hypothetical protein